MNNLDFFSEYESQKRRAQKIFESLDKKIGSNKNELNEAFFGLKFNTAKSREKALKDYFFKITKAPNWQTYSVDLDSSGRQVKIENATPEDLDDAWEFIRDQAVDDEFKGAIKQDGDSIIYQTGGKSNDAQDSDQDANHDLSTDQDAQQKYELIRGKNGVYFFGSTNRSALKIDNAQSQIDTYDWGASPLRWLFENPLNFELKSISFDFKKGIILNVESFNWEGPFVGNTFKGIYKGNSFKGNFFGINNNFQTNPTAFVEGVFYDSTKTGLLGLENTTEIGANDVFNLIQIPVGYSIEILTNNQIRHTISVDKRLDETDSNFAYTIYLGYEIDYSSPIKKIISWEQIRQEYDNYEISKDIKSIPNLLTLQKNESIIELKVIKAGTPPVFNNKEKFNPNKKQEALIYGYNLAFDINDENEFEKFIKLKGYISSSQFLKDLKEVAQLIKDGIIDLNYLSKNAPYLKNILSDFFEQSSLKEVNLINRKGSGYTRYDNNFNRDGNLINTFTGARIKTEQDIEEFLQTKYKDHYSRYGEYPKEYNSDYNYYYNKIIRNTRGSQYNSNIYNQNNTNKKEVNDAVRRLENLIIYFINKIDAGEKTDSIKSLVSNNIIKKSIQKYIPAKNKKETPTAPITPTSENPTDKSKKPIEKKTKNKISKPKAGEIGRGKMTESQIRLAIRNVVNGIL